MLVNSHKKVYRDFCSSHTDILLFMQPWWLDIVCGEKNWDVSLALSDTGELMGALPYYLSKVNKFDAVAMPPLTPFIGIYVEEKHSEFNAYRVYTSEKKILDKLIEGLPDKPFFVQQYHSRLTNWLPFYWQGYQQTTLYTYRFGFPFDIDTTFKNLKSSCRNKIIEAQKSLEVVPAQDVEFFCKLNSERFEPSGKEEPPYSQDLLRRLTTVAAERGQIKIYQAQDGEGLVHASIYLVSDEHTVYNLILDSNRDLSSSSAIQLLLWQGVQYAHSENKAFDFNGSMLHAVEKIFRSFGSERVSYYRLSKTRNRFYDLIRSWDKLF